MKVEAGDVVKVKNGIIKRISGGEFIFIDTKERFVVLNPMDNSVQIKSLNRSLEIVIGIPFIEVQPKPKEKKSLGKFNLNPTPKLSKQDILALIDLALDTGDKEWFNELHSKLSALA